MKSVILFMGSPRKGGNTDLLSAAFLEGAESAGAAVRLVNLYSMDFSPCIECGGCDQSGECILEDDFTPVYAEIEQADIVAVASPIFFYNITSRTQALVERSQAMWIRKYVLKQDTGRKRQGAFLSLGATKGKMLFDGALRVVRYYMDAIGGSLEAALLLRRIEAKGEIASHPTALDSARELGKRMVLGQEIDGIPDVIRP